jgi:hypothetical protein
MGPVSDQHLGQYLLGATAGRHLGHPVEAASRRALAQGLEADGRAERQREDAAHPAGGDMGGGEGGQAQAVRAALNKHGGGEQGQDAAAPNREYARCMPDQAANHLSWQSLTGYLRHR